MKTCTKCKIEKELNLFGHCKHTRDKRQSWCRKCCIDQTRQRNKLPEVRAARRVCEIKYESINKEKIKKRKAQYYKENIDRITQRNAEWAASNPVKRLAITRNHRRKRAAGIKGGAGSAEMSAWIERQKLVCIWCEVNCSENYHIDHIMPLALGGRHETWNMAVSCPQCNTRKNAKHPLDWLAELGYDPGRTRSD